MPLEHNPRQNFRVPAISIVVRGFLHKIGCQCCFRDTILFLGLLKPVYFSSITDVSFSACMLNALVDQGSTPQALFFLLYVRVSLHELPALMFLSIMQTSVVPNSVVAAHTSPCNFRLAQPHTCWTIPSDVSQGPSV